MILLVPYVGNRTGSPLVCQLAVILSAERALSDTPRRTQLAHCVVVNVVELRSLECATMKWQPLLRRHSLFHNSASMCSLIHFATALQQYPEFTSLREKKLLIEKRIEWLFTSDARCEVNRLSLKVCSLNETLQTMLRELCRVAQACEDARQTVDTLKQQLQAVSPMRHAIDAAVGDKRCSIA